MTVFLPDFPRRMPGTEPSAFDRVTTTVPHIKLKRGGRCRTRQLAYSWALGKSVRFSAPESLLARSPTQARVTTGEASTVGNRRSRVHYVSNFACLRSAVHSGLTGFAETLFLIGRDCQRNCIGICGRLWLTKCTTRVGIQEEQCGGIEVTASRSYASMRDFH